MNAHASIGHNNPPEPAPNEAAAEHVEALYAEAKLWLDGSKVENADQAEALGKLYTMLDDAAKAAEAKRKAEKQPHLDAGNAVDKLWKPIVDKAETARKAVKRAVQIWNDELDRIQREEAERVRKEAEEAAAKAQAEHEAAARAGNLAALEEAEQQLANAEQLDRMAARAEKAKPITATGGARGIGKAPTRYIGMLDTGTATGMDEVTAARLKAEHALMSHYWKTRRAWLVEILVTEAQRDIRQGARVIPGLIIEPEKLG